MNVVEENEIIIAGLGIDYEYSSVFLLDIINNLLVGILIIDTDENVIYVNKKYSEITSVRYMDIIHKKLTDIRPNAKLGEVVRTGIEKINLPRKEGVKKYFVDLAPIRRDGKIIGGITIMKDFEDAKIMAKQLKYFEERVKSIESVINNKFGAKYMFEDIIGNSEQIKDTITLAKKLSVSDSSVLITGKTGTGKELFAQSIHNYSKRKSKPFMPINCATIPVTLMESELFGYMPGTFTGSEKNGKIGLFELADGGTVFFDEIENMPMDLQIKLLRVLQEKKIRRIGSPSYSDVNVRIVSATNVDMEELISHGRFREDLYYRICVFPLNIPDLADRRGDVNVLCKYFLDNYNKKNNTKIIIGEYAIKILLKYKWPGNVRELQNIIEYLAGIDDDYLISADDIPNKLKQCRKSFENNEKIGLKDMVKDYERKLLAQYIIKYGNSLEDKKAIADMLQISIATLYNKLKEHRLHFPEGL